MLPSLVSSVISTERRSTLTRTAPLVRHRPRRIYSLLSQQFSITLRSCHLAPGESASQLVSASKNVLLVLPRCFPSDFAPVKRPPVCDGTPVCSIQTWSRPRPDPGPGAIERYTVTLREQVFKNWRKTSVTRRSGAPFFVGVV